MADFSFEEELFSRGFRFVAGVDEAGRGALFGPVVAAAVIFPPHLIGDDNHRWLLDIDDSKRLSAVKRERLSGKILSHAGAVGFGLVTHEEIDRVNIYRASLEAMRRAVANMAFPPDYLLVDGFSLDGVGCRQARIPQGDRRCSTIAAASILAKVLRDRILVRLDRIFAGYGLAQNKGYGTDFHRAALMEMGPSPLHRLSFRLRRENPA